MKAVIVIPARLESQRLPRKLLLNETGKPLIQHTWGQACKVRNADQVLVATDSQEIVNECKRFGAAVVLTSSRCRNGTERVAEVAAYKQYGDWDVFMCWQGDEPEIKPQDVTDLIDHAKGQEIWTLAAPITGLQATDPSRTKVVTTHPGHESKALYFSRLPIPWNENVKDCGHWQHIGIYGYEKNVLRNIVWNGESACERSEKLEQLRWLCNHRTIMVRPVATLPNGINTREDYDAFVERQKVMA